MEHHPGVIEVARGGKVGVADELVRLTAKCKRETDEPPDHSAECGVRDVLRAAIEEDGKRATERTFSTMFLTFLERMLPASSIVKPAIMTAAPSDAPMIVSDAYRRRGRPQ